jgi:hypothetical protein
MYILRLDGWDLLLWKGLTLDKIYKPNTYIHTYIHTSKARTTKELFPSIKEIKTQNQLNTKLYGIRNSAWKNQGLLTSLQNNRIPGVPLRWGEPNDRPPPFRLHRTAERERTPHRQDFQTR